MGEQTVVVPDELDDVRADRVIAVVCGVTRSVARRIIESGAAVVVDGGTTPGAVPLTGSQRLEAGTTLTVTVPDTGPELVARPVAFGVRYEDESVIVVDKPAGLVVHPGAGTTAPTLVAGLVHRYPELGRMADHRWGLVHRLDKDTSGLLVVARTPSGHERLQRELRRRTVARTYLTVVTGVTEAMRGTIEGPIGRDPQHPTRMSVRRDGRPARTHYRRLASWSDASFLEVTLDTGRTHQIRVHLMSIGHDVFGDPVYHRRGRRNVAEGDRQWLHAVRLAFPHPVEDRVVSVESPLPEDLAEVFPRLGTPVWGAVELPTGTPRRDDGFPGATA